MQSKLLIELANLQRQEPSHRERLLKLVWRFCPHGPAFDALLSRRLPELRILQEWDPSDCIPSFGSTAVTIQQCPVGTWSTPLIDTVVLSKCSIGFQSRRILEMGSYIGHTAKILAENTESGVRITTLDEYPEHGAAYRNTSVEKKIDRRIGKVSRERFGADEKYDLIFLDADHHFESVFNDTIVALSLLTEEGVLVWHDYQNKDHFGGWNDVPEVLKLFSSHIPIVAIKGTWLAIYSRYPGWETAKLANKKAPQFAADPWSDRMLRG
jgi:hypothetical protein